jgi:hypothetical protein
MEYELRTILNWFRIGSKAYVFEDGNVYLGSVKAGSLFTS